MELEHFFACPHCDAEISVLLDLTEGQRYIEDCEVCCRPILLSYQATDEQLTMFEAAVV